MRWVLIGHASRKRQRKVAGPFHNNPLFVCIVAPCPPISTENLTLVLLHVHLSGNEHSSYSMQKSLSGIAGYVLWWIFRGHCSLALKLNLGWTLSDIRFSTAGRNVSVLIMYYIILHKSLTDKEKKERRERRSASWKSDEETERGERQMTGEVKGWVDEGGAGCWQCFVGAM